MKHPISFLILTFAFALVVIRKSPAYDFRVESSVLKYRAKHFLKTTEGESKEAKGKFVCANENRDCDFLVALPVRSFLSGNTSRDSHMIAATMGAEYPMIEARGHFAALKPGKFSADIEVHFAGKPRSYSAIPVEVEADGADYRVRAVLPLRLSYHEITRPTLLGTSIKDEVPVTVDLVLRKSP